MNTRSLVLTVLIAGTVTGVLANLPILNLINCALCFWVWLGGGLAVLIYGRLQHGPGTLTASQGAGLGALAGLVGAFVGAVVFLVTSPLSIPIFNGLARSLQIEGDLPFRSNTIGDLVGAAFVFLVMDAVLYPLFGALSGMITANLTRASNSPA